METNKCLCSLIDAALYAIKVIIAGIVAGLLACKNDLKAVSFKFIFAGCHDLPGKVGFTLAISLRARINSAMTGIKCNHPNIARGALSVGRYAIRRISAFQCLLNRLGLNGITITVRIVNRSALGAHGAINDRKRIIPAREIHYMFSAITLQNVGYRCEEICIRFQLRAKNKSSRIISRCRCFNSPLNPIGTYIVKLCGSNGIAIIRGSKGDNLASPTGKARVSQVNILKRRITRFNLPLIHRSICAEILLSRIVYVR